jgi:hypothetical protein
MNGTKNIKGEDSVACIQYNGFNDQILIKNKILVMFLKAKLIAHEDLLCSCAGVFYADASVFYADASVFYADAGVFYADASVFYADASVFYASVFFGIGFTLFFNRANARVHQNPYPPFGS